jgi:hypothetical protein
VSDRRADSHWLASGQASQLLTVTALQCDMHGVDRWLRTQVVYMGLLRFWSPSIHPTLSWYSSN